MSKPVRVRDGVAARVEVLAASERRSFANMVEVLLLAALEGRDGVGSALDARITNMSASSHPSSAVQSGAQTVPVRRPHMKKHRPAVECPTRELVDGVCPDCGWQE